MNHAELLLRLACFCTVPGMAARSRAARFGPSKPAQRRSGTCTRRNLAERAPWTPVRDERVGTRPGKKLYVPQRGMRIERGI